MTDAVEDAIHKVGRHIGFDFKTYQSSKADGALTIEMHRVLREARGPNREWAARGDRPAFINAEWAADSLDISKRAIEEFDGYIRSAAFDEGERKGLDYPEAGIPDEELFKEMVATFVATPWAMAEIVAPIEPRKKGWLWMIGNKSMEAIKRNPPRKARRRDLFKLGECQDASLTPQALEVFCKWLGGMPPGVARDAFITCVLPTEATLRPLECYARPLEHKCPGLSAYARACDQAYDAQIKMFNAIAASHPLQGVDEPDEIEEPEFAEIFEDDDGSKIDLSPPPPITVGWLAGKVSTTPESRRLACGANPPGASAEAEAYGLLCDRERLMAIVDAHGREHLFDTVFKPMKKAVLRECAGKNGTTRREHDLDQAARITNAGIAYEYLKICFAREPEVDGIVGDLADAAHDDVDVGEEGFEAIVAYARAIVLADRRAEAAKAAMRAAETPYPDPDTTDAPETMLNEDAGRGTRDADTAEAATPTAATAVTEGFDRGGYDAALQRLRTMTEAATIEPVRGGRVDAMQAVLDEIRGIVAESIRFDSTRDTLPLIERLAVLAARLVALADSVDDGIAEEARTAASRETAPHARIEADRFEAAEGTVADCENAIADADGALRDVVAMQMKGVDLKVRDLAAHSTALRGSTEVLGRRVSAATESLLKARDALDPTTSTATGAVESRSAFVADRIDAAGGIDADGANDGTADPADTIKPIEDAAPTAAVDALEPTAAASPPDADGEVGTDEPGVAADVSAIGTDPDADIAAESRPPAAVTARLIEAIGDAEYGIAHEICRNARLAGYDPGVDALAMRIANRAGTTDHEALAGDPQRAVEMATETLTVADGDSGSDEIAGEAVGLAILPAAIELALFHPASGAYQAVEAASLACPDAHDAISKVAGELAAMSHSNVTPTYAMLATTMGGSDPAIERTKAIEAILDAIGRLRSTNYAFQVMNKIKLALSESQEPIGRLQRAADAVLKGGDDQSALLVAGRDVIETLGTPDRALAAANAHQPVNFKVAELSGAARKKYLYAITAIVNAAKAHAEIAGRSHDSRDARRLAESIGRLVDHVRALRDRVEAIAMRDDLVGRVARNVGPRLAAIDRALIGQRPASRLDTSRDEEDATLEIEAALVPGVGLEAGSRFLAGDPKEIIDALAANRPYERRAATKALAAAKRYVGAWRLLEFADDATEADAARRTLTELANRDVKRLKAEVASRAALVERVTQFGSLRQREASDAADALAERLVRVRGAVNGAGFPFEAEASDAADSEPVGDVAFADAALAAIDRDARALLEAPRRELLEQIVRLNASDLCSDENAQRLRGLCDGDELHTVEEVVDAIGRGGRFLDDSAVRRRTDAFLQLLEGMGEADDAPARIRAAIEDGARLGPLAYDALTRSARTRAADALTQFETIVYGLEKLPAKTLDEDVVALLQRFAIKVETDGRPDGRPGNGIRGLHALDLKLRVARDAESVIVPDFGSQAAGYRVVVAAALPAMGTLDNLKPAGSYGLIVIVGEPVGHDRRMAFLAANLRDKRRVLLIDHLSMASALAEPEPRGATLIETAQPWSYAAPYRDWGKESVPPEMFVGRREDIRRIMDHQNPSTIVYGGRRLGKSALLRHLKETEHAPRKGMHVGYVDAQEIGDGANPTHLIWPEIARSLPDVFNDPKSLSRLGTMKATEVMARITAKLNEDPHNHIIVEIDEADRFVLADAQQHFAEFLAMQRLMTQTQRRFRIVLAGLSNVTRLAQAGNSPAEMVSADPRRIGALIGAEFADAEELLARPLAGLGIRFERREDIWRLLSHASHFPILVQSYAERLIELRAERLLAGRGTAWTIGRDLVDRVLTDEKVGREVKRIFNITLQIDRRYEVIAYAIAHKAIKDSEAGGDGNVGMSVAEIRREAREWWEAGFSEAHRHSLVADLVDEMEGMGVLAPASDRTWKLRSTGVLRQLGSVKEIEDVLESFIERAPEIAFDPKSHRRKLRIAEADHYSPLTLAQEQETLREAAGIRIMLGPDDARPDLVPAALRQAQKTTTDLANALSIVDDAFTTVEELKEEIRECAKITNRRTLIVVHPEGEWETKWIGAVKNLIAVKSGHVGVTFVGGPKQAEDVYRGSLTDAGTIRVVHLEPFSEAFLRNELRARDVVERFDAKPLLEGTGGWSAPLSQLMPEIEKRLRTSERNQAGIATLADDLEAPKAQMQASPRSLRMLTLLARNERTRPFLVADVGACAELHRVAMPMPAGKLVAFAHAAGLLEEAPTPKGGDALYRFRAWAFRRFDGFEPAEAAE